MDEITYTPKFALLSPDDYKAWNEKIGELLGFPSQGTEYYAPEEPQMINGLCVLPITVEVQQLAEEKGVILPEMIDSLPTETTDDGTQS